MKEISIRIPDKQVSFIIELLQKFDFVKIDYPKSDKNFLLNESQKKSIEIERKKSKNEPDYLMNWDVVKNDLKV